MPGQMDKLSMQITAHKGFATAHHCAGAMALQTTAAQHVTNCLLTGDDDHNILIQEQT